MLQVKAQELLDESAKGPSPERAAEMVGDPARIQAGTDCGFDTSAGMGRLTPDVVWAKLKAMQDGARIASERLF